MLESVMSGPEIMSARDDNNGGINPSRPSVLSGLRLIEKQLPQSHVWVL